MMWSASRPRPATSSRSSATPAPCPTLPERGWRTQQGSTALSPRRSARKGTGCRGTGRYHEGRASICSPTRSGRAVAGALAGVNPYVFIVGSARSGTTLLQRMVDAHPQIAVIHETRWIPRYFRKRTGLTPEGFVTPELIPKLLEFRRFPKMKVGREELEGLIDSGEPVSYSSFVSAIYDLYGQREGKSLVGDKTPGYVRNIPILHGLWPAAKFVHIIRDGRDVCLSVLNWKKAQVAKARRHASWSEDPVSTTALWW